MPAGVRFGASCPLLGHGTAFHPAGEKRHGTKEGAHLMGDVVYFGIPFVFLGLCLLYVRAADRL
jgi:hypothetical protein